ncbi:MAG: hypothetical protein HOP14_02960 [Acidobacteria bacterium]|nr:hypothetical protein [Acidobacteriota bacterium]
MTSRTAVGAVAIGAVVAAVAAGLFVLDSPGEARLARLDSRRVEDLQALAASVNVFSTRRGRLPASLEELWAEPGITLISADPAGVPYEYRRLGEGAYEVCAVFERPSDDPRSTTFWVHGAGRQCFSPAVRSVN